MKFLKTYEDYLIKLFLKKLLIITGVFASLTFILNILEELKFFNELNLSFHYPFLFTFLNLPSVIFEIFPFIVLISTQLFFIHLYGKDEIIIFKNYGIKNIDIIKIISIVTFLFGLFLVLGFHYFSSSLKHNYLSFKNNFTKDNKYLAVINENGLWIKDEINQSINIINAEEIEGGLLKKVSISLLNEQFKPLKTIQAEEVDIKSNIWIIKNAKVFNLDGTRNNENIIEIESNFNLEKINNLFSNLSSLNIFELNKQYEDYKSLGYSTLEIRIEVNKLYSLPVYLVLMILIGSILMLNTKHNKSKIFNIISGILLSVLIYYINYFFNVMGTNERVPVIISVWFPLFILFLISLMGLLKINEK